MKTILGLDLGTTSVGWALVKEAENASEKSEIIKLGVRLVPLTTDERSNFEKGKSITTNADRTQKRGMRRNLQRYKLRKKALIETLVKEGWIPNDFTFSEEGPSSTFSTLNLRAKAATEEVTLAELAKILLQINKKRGYKSSRKQKDPNDGSAIDGMSVAKEMYDNNQTPGEYVYQRILKGRYATPEFYKSDLKQEFDAIWKFQSQFYPQLDDKLYKALENQNKSQTGVTLRNKLNLSGFKSTAKGKERIKESYYRRHIATKQQLDLEQLALVLQDINGQISGLSGLLCQISDRSKELYFNNMTVGQMLVKRINENPNNSLKNIVFYRQDYLDEFETIWKTQAKYHPELTDDLKHTLRDIIIFYQRPLKSQKDLVSLCEFESREMTINVNGVSKTKVVGPRVCPKSSPLFQEFKIWQTINNILIDGQPLDEQSKKIVFEHLTYRDVCKGQEILKLLSKTPKNQSINFKELDGNKTMSSFLNACIAIAVQNGYDEDTLKKLSTSDLIEAIRKTFDDLGFNCNFLNFDSNLTDSNYEKQDSFRLWHLLYSYEGDNSKSGNESLIAKIMEIGAMDQDAARIISTITLQPDYGNLSSKALRKILPYMNDGVEYSAACALAGYRHSKQSLTKEEIENKTYCDHLQLLKRNSLRNPVVEKILNQMINVVNAIVDNYGKPDEIRIELARDLKKNAKQRKSAQETISKATKDNESYIKVLREEFNITNPSRNDIIRYRLYLELKDNGFKTLYSDTYIPKEKLFSKEFEIEHIIPQARLFDDSFANKTLETHDHNLQKGKNTAYDYVLSKWGDDGIKEYKSRLDNVKKSISQTKFNRLMMKGQDIPDDFINRELRDSQYIAKKAREILNELVKFVVPTTGSITARLREDWQLVDVMRELNWDKYSKLGLTYYQTDKDGRKIPKIKDWTKRNDHRHHAMDALTIAFTRRQFIQYLNHLNARIEATEKDEIDLRDFDLDNTNWSDYRPAERNAIMHSLQEQWLYLDHKGKRRFRPPMPLDELRQEAKKQLENTLVSFKAKNKVCTQNINISKGKDGLNRKVQLTPRGQLHNDTIYRKTERYVTKEETVGSNFTLEKIESVSKKCYRNALKQRLQEFGGDPTKAFTGKNHLSKNTLWIDEFHTTFVPERVTTVCLESIYTTRKPIDKDLKVDKVIDKNIRNILKARLSEYGDNTKLAFSNLDENPIWLNKERGISIKRVTIDGGVKPIAIRDKRDSTGALLHDAEGHTIPNDYVATGGNHHAAFFRDNQGKVTDVVVSFFEATQRKNLGYEVIDKNYKKDEGWEFLFTVKQNEYFVFSNPKTGFNPYECNLTDPTNFAEISPNLYRAQKLSQGDYWFRHHLDTTVETSPTLRDITWKRINSFADVTLVKVRVDNLGRLVSVGEYD